MLVYAVSWTYQANDARAGKILNDVHEQRTSRRTRPWKGLYKHAGASARKLWYSTFVGIITVAATAL